MPSPLNTAPSAGEQLERRVVTPIAGSGVFTVYTEEAYSDWRARIEHRLSEDNDRIKRIVASVPAGPVVRWLSPPPDATQFSDLSDRYPNCRGVIDTLRDYAALCCAQTGFRFPPIVLVGRPGAGKTALARALGRQLQAPPVFINMAGASGGFTLGGLDLRWASGSPGAVFEHLALAHRSMPANRLFVLDEIDKAERTGNSNPLGHLYSLVEPSTARAFRDEAVDLPIDSSGLLWIATANDLDGIPAPLRSRFEAIEVPQPTEDESRAVVCSVWHDLRIDEAWWAHRFAARLSEDVIDRLTQYESARAMAKALRRAAGRARRRGAQIIDVNDVPLPTELGRGPGVRMGFM